jgi:hypothetical protein
LEGQRGFSNSGGRGRAGGGRRHYASMDNQSMGVERDRGQGLDNKHADSDMRDTNKVAESIFAEKTAKLHRLLGEKEERGFRLDLESPESEKLTDSVSEKEEKEVDELEEEADSVSLGPPCTGRLLANNDLHAGPVKRRVKKRSELPLGWEKHEVSRVIPRCFLSIGLSLNKEQGQRKIIEMSF